MNLKVPTKVFLNELDKAIESGYLLKEDLLKNFWLEHEAEQQSAFERLNKLSGVAKSAQTLQTNFGLILSEERIHEYETRLKKWVEQVSVVLGRLFTDKSPVIRFKSVKYDPSEVRKSPNGWYSDISVADEIELQFTAHLKILEGWYDQVAKEKHSPLNYDEETCTIWFNSQSCVLSADTSMSDLCRFMFRHDIGEKVEYADIIKFLFGIEGKLSKIERGQVDNAMRAVNDKTKEKFKFPLFSKESSTLSIKLTSQLVRSSR